MGGDSRAVAAGALRRHLTASETGGSKGETSATICFNELSHGGCVVRGQRTLWTHRRPVRRATPEWAAPITDLPAGLIRESARAMGRERPRSVIVPGRHVVWYGNDTQRMRAVYIVDQVLEQGGVALWFAKGHLGPSGLAVAAIVHDLSMLGLSVLMIGHVYFTFLYDALSAMRTGYVAEDCARMEHLEWFEDLSRDTHEKAPRPGGQGADL